MADVLQLPDRGKALREKIGARLTVKVGKGKRPHRATVFHVAYTVREHGRVEGVEMETDCGLRLGFEPFDERQRGLVKTEHSAFEEVGGGGELCRRCGLSVCAQLMGRSRKRAYLPAPRPKAKRAETFAEVKKRREREAFHAKVAEVCFGVPLSEVKRRGLVKEGRGRGTGWRLGKADGSEGPPAA